MTTLLVAAIAFWVFSMALLGFALWWTSKRRAWRRVCPSFVEWVATAVETPSPAGPNVRELEDAVTLILDDLAPPHRRPTRLGGAHTAVGGTWR